jgi:flagellar protein FlaG
MSDMTINISVTPVDQTGHLSLVKPQAPAIPPVSQGASPASAAITQASRDNSGNGAVPQGITGSLEKAAAEVEKYLPKAPPGTQLRIEKDNGTGLFVYQSVNAKSGEVVAQYPTEQILKFVSFFRAKEGIAVDQQA